MDLDQRKQLVLGVIVEDYITEGEPVGSKAVAKKIDNSFSSATIRNEMSALTSLGLIEQPHTSAGRIPSFQGFQFYIEHLMPRKPISLDEQREIEAFFSQNSLTNAKSLLDAASKTLSVLTRYAAIMTTPESVSTVYGHVQLMPAANRLVVVLLVTTSGTVEHRLTKLTVTISKEESADLAWKINKKLEQIPMGSIHSSMFKEFGRAFQPIFTTVEEMAEQSAGGEIILTGQNHLFSYKELAQNPQNVLSMLEDAKLRILLREAGNMHAMVMDNKAEQEHTPPLGLVTARYNVSDHVLGNIGIIGPVRMNYSEMVPYVGYFAKLMGNVMMELIGPPDEPTPQKGKEQQE